MTGAGVLDDHRRLGVATLAALLLFAAIVSLALVAAGRPHAVAGVLTGALVGGADVLLLVRGVTRFGRMAERGVSSRGLTGGLLSRFVAVAGLLGMAMAAHSLNPIAVLSGFLLMPPALVAVGCVAIRRSTGAGGARRHQIAR